MGSRSKSQAISPFNLEEVCRNRPHQYNIGKIYHELEDIVNEARAINKQLTSKSIFLDDAHLYFIMNYPEHHKKLKNPDIPTFLLNDDNDDGEWRRADKNNKKRKRSIIEQWVNGDDLMKAQRLKELFFNPFRKSERESDVKYANQFWVLDNDEDSSDGSVNDEGQDSIDYEFRNWALEWRTPTTNRSLKVLKVLIKINA